MDHNIDLLVNALFEVLREGGNLDSKLEKLVPHLIGADNSDPNLIARLNTTISQLNELNYQARWEASPEGPRVMLSHCPYAAILSENPELCQMDASILKTRLNQNVDQIAKLERGPQGMPHCVFLIR
jgi:predicted ArsR family transcriptional regulator